MMDGKIIALLKESDSSLAHSRILLYYEFLTKEQDGWKLAFSSLMSSDSEAELVKFFCLQIIEYFVSSKYWEYPIETQIIIRNYFCQFMQKQCVIQGEKIYIRNKAAHILALLFIQDFPNKWPTFFSDFIQLLPLGHIAVDYYFRLLVAIDTEVVDREVMHSKTECERNTIIKDYMRENNIQDLVNSWYQILKTYEINHPDIASQCLNVIGLYVSWIDINLVANEKFVAVFMEQIRMHNIREAVADCISEIVNKGMDPVAKFKLIESFASVLHSTGVLMANENLFDDSDFGYKMSKLVNTFGCNLLESFNKLTKSASEISFSVLQAVQSKVPVLLYFLAAEDDDVSSGVFDFAREYLQLLKSKSILSDQEKEFLEKFILTVLSKAKYGDDYNFNREGENEALFIDYRKQLKVLFDNIAGVNKDLVILVVQKFVESTLDTWHTLSFQDVEAALYFLYILGEGIPGSQLLHFQSQSPNTSPMISMMHKLLNSSVSSHPHPAVSLQFLETVARYDKFFLVEKQHIPDVLMAFLDHRGMQNSSPKVRSRAAYIFSRFIKSLKAHISSYAENILLKLGPLMRLHRATPEQDLLSHDDQLYIFEAAGIIIVSCWSENLKRQALMKQLLTPVLDNYRTLVSDLSPGMESSLQEHVFINMSHAVAVTARTSKAFSPQATMKICGCNLLYLDALQVFLTGLHVPIQSGTLLSAVRQYLHRMVVCLEEDLLPHLPTTLEALLKSSDLSSVQECIPLINQIVTKFRKKIVPLLQHIFMPLVQAIVQILGAQVEDNDQQWKQDVACLQRSYFLFISAIVNNDVSEVVATLNSDDLHLVLTSIVQGADIPDPVAQKTCFCILKKLIQVWGGSDASPIFIDFIYKRIVPVCFMAPLKPTFDLSDAQTIQALAESAMCLKMVHEKRGEEFLLFLTTDYLPKLDLTDQVIKEYCQALGSDQKVFRNYLKLFFKNAQS